MASLEEAAARAATNRGSKRKSGIGIAGDGCSGLGGLRLVGQWLRQRDDGTCGSWKAGSECGSGLGRRIRAVRVAARATGGGPTVVEARRGDHGWIWAVAG